MPTTTMRESGHKWPKRVISFGFCLKMKSFQGILFYSLLYFTVVVHNENLMSLQKNTKRTPRFDFLYSHWHFWGESTYLPNGWKGGFIPWFLEKPFLHSFCQIFGIFENLLIFNKVNRKGINRFIFGKQVNLALK